MAEEAATGTREWARLWLSEERLVPYLETCGGDAGHAIELHEWNISLAQVLMRDVAHLEVALRNAYDRVLSEHWDGASHWLFDPGSPVRRPILRKSGAGKMRDVNLVNRKAIDTAAGLARGTEGPGKVIASLTLGFWAHMTDRSRERDLWIPILHDAWPRGYDRADLQRRFLAINTVRNRVTHNERLFDPKEPQLSPLAADTDLVALFRALCPEAAARLHGGATPVERFLAESPAPAAVRLYALLEQPLEHVAEAERGLAVDLVVDGALGMQGAHALPAVARDEGLLDGSRGPALGAGTDGLLDAEFAHAELHGVLPLHYFIHILPAITSLVCPLVGLVYDLPR